MKRSQDCERLAGIIPAFDASPYPEQLMKAIEGGPRGDAIETESGILRLAGNAARLPQELRELVGEFKAHSDDAGALLIRSLPCSSNLRSTPTDQHAARYVDDTAANLLGMIASLLGEIFGYSQLDRGALFRSVFPVASEMWEQSSKGSRKALLLHTEQTFHPYRPRYLMLLCLRGDANVKTSLCSLNSILPQLSQCDRDALARCEYVTGIDYAFGNEHTTKGNGATLSIVGGSADNPVFSFDEDLMVGATAEASEILERLKTIAAASRVEVCLRPGDLLIVDNNRAAHGRSSFTPRLDGADRWLMQVKTLDALPPAGPHRKPGTRIVCTQFE